jgi:hypothetical protein
LFRMRLADCQSRNVLKSYLVVNDGHRGGFYRACILSGFGRLVKPFFILFSRTGAACDRSLQHPYTTTDAAPCQAFFYSFFKDRRVFLFPPSTARLVYQPGGPLSSFFYSFFKDRRVFFFPPSTARLVYQPGGPLSSFFYSFFKDRRVFFFPPSTARLVYQPGGPLSSFFYSFFKDRDGL